MDITKYINKIICGDALKVLAEFPAESIDMVMFSPPYYGGFRNYGETTETVWGGEENCAHEWIDGKADFCVKCGAWRGQLGSEPSWQMYVEHMVMVCREVKRVLKKTGSMYTVLGDTYTGSQAMGYKPKCLMGIPWRVAFALIDDGWILRNDIIWHKPNAMPSSVKDRLSNTYEHIFFFVKNKRYYYDLDAIRLPHKTESIERYEGALKFGGMYAQGSKTDMARQIGLGYPRQPPKSFNRVQSEKDEQCYGKDNGRRQRVLQHLHEIPRDVFHVPKHSKFLLTDVKTASPAARALKTLKEGKLTTLVRRKLYDVGAYLKQKMKQSGWSMEELAQKTGIKQTTLEHYFRTDLSGQAIPNRQVWNLLKPLLNLDEYDSFVTEEIRNALPQPHPLGRNPSDFWSASTEPTKGVWCLSCKANVQHENMKCAICGGDTVTTHFAIYPEKICIRAIKSSCPPNGIVLDPMCGSGTTLVVAKKLGRNYIGIDINPQYCEITKIRLSEITEKLTKWLGV